MDLNKFKEILALIKDSDVCEVNLTEDNQSIFIKRQLSITQKTDTVSSVKNTTIEESNVYEPNEYIVRSPIVGTFYTSPSPEAKAFVEVGMSINKGDILCIIEAMKMMNYIEAEYSGVITAIHLENSSPAEYEQPLFTIKKD